jgi:hypothetical protein
MLGGREVEDETVRIGDTVRSVFGPSPMWICP